MEWEEEHELETLEDLFDYLDLDQPDEDQLDKLFAIFNRDMEDDPIFINEVRIVYNKASSRHPLFKGKPEGFEHVCTRKSKHSKKRYFEPQRANKIHWIKQVINYQEDSRIRYFEELHGQRGQNQRFFWFYEKNYIVIVREITDKLQLITAFCVDKIEKDRYKGKYDRYISK